MDGILLPMLAAGAVALLAWFVVGLVTGSGGEGRRKLKERLSTEAVPSAAISAQRPLMMQASDTGLPAFLAQKAAFQQLQRRVNQAWPDLSVHKFLFFAVVSGLGLYSVATFLSGNGLVGLGAGAAGVYAPFFLLERRRNKLHLAVTDQLPEALDFLSRVMRAGHSLSTGLQMMADELPEPLSSEFRRCYDQHSLGQPLEDALKDMSARINSTDFSFFVTAVLIQRQTGGDLAEVLGNISGMIRGRLRLQKSVRAKTAEGRFTGYIMVAFPAVMFCIAYFLNPDYGTVLLHTTTGLKLLGTAFGLQMLGLFMIKKITTVAV